MAILDSQARLQRHLEVLHAHADDADSDSEPLVDTNLQVNIRLVDIVLSYAMFIGNGC